jgi:hypothetical protein
MKKEIRLEAIECTTRRGKNMIPEPEGHGSQPILRRDNNLLCVAVILFIIGLYTLQIAWITIEYWSFFSLWSDISLFNTLILIVLLLVGTVSTLGGVYLMWKWWKSGS